MELRVVLNHFDSFIHIRSYSWSINNAISFNGGNYSISIEETTCINYNRTQDQSHFQSSVNQAVEKYKKSVEFSIPGIDSNV